MDGKSVSSQRLAHLGKILFNLSILGAVLCIASLISYVLIAFYYLILIMILLCTLFLILVYVPDFMDLFKGGEGMMELLVMFSNTYVPIIAPVTSVLAALSIAALALSRQKNVARIVFAVIFFIIGAAFTAMRSIVGGIGE